MFHEELDINKITSTLKIFVRVFCSKFPDIRPLFNVSIVEKRASNRVKAPNLAK